MYTWYSFIDAADDWLLAYSMFDVRLAPISPTLFSSGHAVELALKAVYVKQTRDIKRAIELKHDIAEILNTCKRNDPTFLPVYELRQNVIDVALDYMSRIRQQLSLNDFKHFSRHRALYYVAALHADLKYIGVPFKNKAYKNHYGMVWIYPDPYWVQFFKAIRAYLGHPDRGRIDRVKDRIKEALDSGFLSQQSSLYLQGLYK